MFKAEPNGRHDGLPLPREKINAVKKFWIFQTSYSFVSRVIQPH